MISRCVVESHYTTVVSYMRVFNYIVCVVTFQIKVDIEAIASAGAVIFNCVSIDIVTALAVTSRTIGRF